MTITTVGYGDRYPVTLGGRTVGMVLMTFGIGIFGVLTSFMSSIFLPPPKSDANGSEPSGAAPLTDAVRLEAELAGLRAELAEIKALLRERG